MGKRKKKKQGKEGKGEKRVTTTNICSKVGGEGSMARDVS
jgi:hypothetical protein